MSLILAVEPDKRQAKQLAAAVRQHVRGELVVAESGAAALKALGDRVPDLILTPALLPPKDEAVLTGWLREMGDSAAHVQTLAIPILSDTPARGKEQNSPSIFGRMRDQQGDSGQGCDPRVFADQVKVYLERASADRPTREKPVLQPVVVPINAAAEESAPEVEEFDDAMTFEDLVFDPSPANDPKPAPTPLPVAEPPAVMKAPRPFARPDKRVDAAAVQPREVESVESSTSATASPLWRLGADTTPETTVIAARHVEPGAFDPNDARYSPLFRRLDDLAAAQHP